MLSKEIQAYQIVKYNKELLKTVTQVLPELIQDDTLENYDVQFKTKAREILTQHLELSTKKLFREVYIAKMQALAEEYVALEKKGLQFKAFISLSAIPPQIEVFTVQGLTDLHRFLQERYTLGQQSTLRLLENSIFMFIHANKVEDALMRTEVLKNLLPESAAQSDNFKSLRASVLALNGEFDEWRGILAKKREAATTEKLHQKQKILKNIKKQQEEAQQQKAKEEERKKVVTTKKAPRPQRTPETQDSFQSLPKRDPHKIYKNLRFLLLDKRLKHENLPMSLQCRIQFR